MVILVSILILLIACGYALDRVLYHKEKPIFYSYLQKVLFRINATDTPKLHVKLISSTLSLFRRFKSRFWKEILFTLLISWLLTSILSWLSPLRGFDPRLPLYTIYVPNFIFDFISINITYHILKVIIKSKAINFFLLCFLDLLISGALVILCFVAINVFHNTTEEINNQWRIRESTPGTTVHQNFLARDLTEASLNEIALSTNSNIDSSDTIYYSLSVNSIVEITRNSPTIISKLMNGEEYPFQIPVTVYVRNQSKESKGEVWETLIGYSPFFWYSLSTFIPTVLFILILLIAYISKSILHLAKITGTRIVYSAIDNIDEDSFENFKPGEHFAKVLAVFVALLGVISQVIKIITS